MDNKKPKFNNIIRVPCTIDTVFRFWLEFLIPFHHFTTRELNVATAFLKERYRLSKVISDNNILDKVIMSDEVYKNIMNEYHLSSQHFQVIRSKLKAKNFIVDNKINPRLVPNIKEDKGTFQLLLLLELK